MKKIFIFLSMCFALTSGFAATEETSKDPEIVAFMIVLNKNEISAADLTKQKTVSDEVKSYADLMSKEHTQSLNDTEALSKKEKINPLDSDMVISLRDKGSDEINTLKPLVNKEYEVAYIDAMVKGHTEALANIDTFIGEANNPELKTLLKDTRTHVEHHLTKAQEIQKTLQ